MCREYASRLHVSSSATIRESIEEGALLIFIAVLGAGEESGDAAKALASWGVAGTSFLVESGDSSKDATGVRALPATVIIDATGTLRWMAPTNATSEDVLRALP